MSDRNPQRDSRRFPRWGIWSLALCGIGFMLATTELFSQEATPVADADRAVVSVDNPHVRFLDKAILSSSRIGIIERIDVREGDLVKAGQIVVQLRDEVPRANYLTAKQTSENDVEIRYSTAAYDLAKVEYERAVEANRRVKHAFPEIEVDRLRLTAEKSALQIEQAHHQRKVDRLKRDEAFEVLKTFRIDAQMDGMITKVNKVIGEAVREGDPLIEMVNVNRVKVEGFVHVDQSVKLKRGQLVKVQIDIRDEELEVEKEVFEGTLVFIDIFTRSDGPFLRVWAEVKNRNNLLRDGLRATMKIYPDQQGPQITIDPGEKKPEAKQPLPPPKDPPKEKPAPPVPQRSLKTASNKTAADNTAAKELQFEPPVRID